MKVLLAEDDPVTRKLLQVTLTQWGYEVIAVKDGAAAWQVLQRPDAPRLAILDWMMPGLSGLQLCKAVRDAKREMYSYLIILTSKVESADVIQGFDAGADDYLIKPVNPQELRLRVGAGRRVLQLQDELIAAREMLRIQATRDSLTGLMNRGAIVEHFEREMSRTERQSEPIGVAMIDLDHFKKINDTHGHLIGDVVLREAAIKMRKALRTYDEVGRYGGEEFLAVLTLEKPSPSVLWRIGERLRKSVSNSPISTPAGALNVTVSIGIAVSSVADRYSPTDLIQAADKALYRAKDEGRNRLVIYGNEVTPLKSDEAAFQAQPHLHRLINAPLARQK